jgi:hypothetical protein
MALSLSRGVGMVTLMIRQRSVASLITQLLGLVQKRLS